MLISAALAVLLGVTATLLVLDWRDGQEICPFASDFRQGLRGRMGPGMMGSGGMLGRMGASINSEHDFLVHMIPHHQEAVTTAGILKGNTERQEMREFAESIIRTQSEEIELMTAWLSSWYPQEDHDVDYQPMMRDLEGLKGEVLDRVFLEDMIDHHMAAVMMSQQLIRRGLAEHEGVTSLARSIRDTQINEIHLMSSWMLEWYGAARTGGQTVILVVGLAVLIALAVLAVWLIRASLIGPGSKSGSVRSARELLDTRYAGGQISQKEYLTARENLED